MQTGLENLISETDQEICNIMNVEGIFKEISKSSKRTSSVSEDAQRGAGVSSFYSKDYQYMFPRNSSYEESITNIGVLASFADEEVKPERIVFPYDSSLESDPIYKSDQLIDGEDFKTSALITEVINKIISPIHASYKREMLRLEMKEKQLEDEESPNDSKSPVGNFGWETPYKSNPESKVVNPSILGFAPQIASAVEDTFEAVDKPFVGAFPGGPPDSRPPPDPRPPPSFFLKSKPPLPQNPNLPQNFYDNENLPPPFLGNSSYSLYNPMDEIVTNLSNRFSQTSISGKAAAEDPIFKPVATQSQQGKSVQPIVPPVKPAVLALPGQVVQPIKVIPQNQQLPKPTPQPPAPAKGVANPPPPRQSSQPTATTKAATMAAPPNLPAPVPSASAPQNQSILPKPIPQSTQPPKPAMQAPYPSLSMEYYNYYNPNFNPNFNPNYNYAYNNYPPRPVVYPQAQPPVPRKPEAPSASINSMPPSSLSHQSQPFFPTNHNLYAPQPAPYRPPFHPQVHNFVPQTGGDNPDDDSLPLIYHYPQHVPVFRPEQFANNPANPKLSAEYTANSQSPFLEKREYLKRQLQLSPTTKQQFTDFFRLFKLKEKEGFEATKKFAAENFAHLPPKVHWKVYLEMADLAKRENKFKEARKYYEIVNHIQPYGCKGWLEYAKMEEESGRLHDCTRILADGLYFCPHSESLLVKGIKHSERMDNIDASRALLSRLKNVAIERSWRTIMEGGLLESRQGNISVARQIFKYLMEKVPSYGPIYTEAVRLEMRMEEYSRGLKLVEKGLQRIPSYGPLWFLAIKLEERLGKDFTKRVEEAVPNLSKELVWKIYFELAQIEERKGNFKNCYKAYVQSVLNCPSRNLVWKVWLGGARTELHKGNIDASRKLLFRALQNVPSKMKATALLECARFEEFLGDLEDARYILRKAKKETRHEWKVFLESVLLEMRANELDRALNEVSEALDVHSTTGRLWAVLIQLTHLKNLTNDSVSAQTKVFRNALTNVPKSGEVWCEGARIALHQGLLDSARKYLDFAIQFTPQYGDSFIEHLRLEMLCLKTDDIENALELPESKAALDKLELQCLNAEPTYGVCWTYCKEHPLDSARQCLRNAKRQLIQMAKERASMSKMKVSDMTPQQLRKWKILETLDIAASFFGEKSEETEAAQKEFKFRTIFS